VRHWTPLERWESCFGLFSDARRSCEWNEGLLVPDPAEKPVRLDERLALRPAEAARALGIGERTLRQLLPTLPHIRAGGTVLLPVEGLRRWLEQQAKSEEARGDAVAREILDEMQRGK